MLSFEIIISSIAVYEDFSFTYESWLCAASWYIVAGFYQILICNILLMIGWKFFAAAYDIAKFVIEHNLPSE